MIGGRPESSFHNLLKYECHKMKNKLLYREWKTSVFYLHEFEALLQSFVHVPEVNLDHDSLAGPANPRLGSVPKHQGETNGGAPVTQNLSTLQIELVDHYPSNVLL